MESARGDRAFGGVLVYVCRGSLTLKHPTPPPGPDHPRWGPGRVQQSQDGGDPCPQLSVILKQVSKTRVADGDPPPTPQSPPYPGFKCTHFHCLELPPPGPTSSGGSKCKGGMPLRQGTQGGSPIIKALAEGGAGMVHGVPAQVWGTPSATPGWGFPSVAQRACGDGRPGGGAAGMRVVGCPGHSVSPMDDEGQQGAEGVRHLGCDTSHLQGLWWGAGDTPPHYGGLDTRSSSPTLFFSKCNPVCARGGELRCPLGGWARGDGAVGWPLMPGGAGDKLHRNVYSNQAQRPGLLEGARGESVRSDAGPSGVSQSTCVVSMPHEGQRWLVPMCPLCPCP